MSPNLGSRWTTWGTVSSGFREIEIGWDRLESVGLLAPFLAPSHLSLLLDEIAQLAGRAIAPPNQREREHRGFEPA